jgi:hypothetical protein
LQATCCPRRRSWSKSFKRTRIRCAAAALPPRCRRARLSCCSAFSRNQLLLTLSRICSGNLLQFLSEATICARSARKAPITPPTREPFTEHAAASCTSHSRPCAALLRSSPLPPTSAISYARDVEAALDALLAVPNLFVNLVSEPNPAHPAHTLNHGPPRKQTETPKHARSSAAAVVSPARRCPPSTCPSSTP